MKRLAEIFNVTMDELINTDMNHAPEECCPGEVNNISLSDNLKVARKALGYTLLDVSQKVGVSEATVQRWESGNIKNIKYDNLVKLASVLRVEPAKLLGWIDADSTTTVSKETTIEELNPYHYALHKRVNELDESMSSRVFDLLEDYLLCGEYEQGKISTMANMLAFKYRENKQAETKDREYYDYVTGITMVAESSVPYGSSRNDIEPDGPHPYHGPDEDLVKAVAEKDTKKTLEDLKDEVKVKETAREVKKLYKGRPAK